MNNYLLTIIITAIAIGLCDVIAPAHNGIEKYVKYIGMLIILSVVISPITAFVSQIDDGILDSLKDKITDYESSNEDYSNIFNDYLLNSSLSQLDDKLKEILQNEFEISPDEVKFNILTKQIDKGIALSKVQVLLSGSAIFKNPYLIEDRFAELLGCEVEVLMEDRRKK